MQGKFSNFPESCSMALMDSDVDTTRIEALDSPLQLARVTIGTSHLLAHKDTKYKRSTVARGLGSRIKALSSPEFPP